MHFSHTRARIIQSGEKLFARYGISNVTIRQIAKESGVNRSTIYYYYQSKEDLFEHILNHIELVFGEDFSIAVEKNDPLEQVSEFCWLFFDKYNQNINLVTLFLDERIKSNQNERVKKTIRKVENTINEALEKILDNCRDLGYLKSDLSNLVYIKMIFGILVETVLFQKRSGSLLKNENQTHQFLTFRNEAIHLIKGILMAK